MKLPVLSGVEVVKIFSKVGWKVARQTGSHIIMKRGTLRSLIADSGLTVKVRAVKYS